jgi:hypothetical protein
VVRLLRLVLCGEVDVCVSKVCISRRSANLNTKHQPQRGVPTSAQSINLNTKYQPPILTRSQSQHEVPTTNLNTKRHSQYTISTSTPISIQHQRGVPTSLQSITLSTKRQPQHEVPTTNLNTKCQSQYKVATSL